MVNINPKFLAGIFSTILFGCLFIIISGVREEKQLTLPVYFIANQNYNSGNYPEAVKGFLQALKENPGLLQKEPLIRFKIGYAFYQSGEFEKTIDVLETGRKYLGTIDDYIAYFQILSFMKLQDTVKAVSKMNEFRMIFYDSPLIPLLDSISSELTFKQNQPDTALHYLTRMLGSGYFNRDGIYLRMMDLYLQKDDSSRFRKYAYLFLNQFPFHDRAESVYSRLLGTYTDKIPLQQFQKLSSYLISTDQFLALEKLWKNQQSLAETGYEREYYTWFESLLLYEQGEFDRVLKWCLKNRNSFRNPTILRNIDLNIARCYLRTGNTDKSINAYLQFQRRYPRDKLSPEVLWKVAWLYEEKKNLDMAIKIYKQLIKTYRRSSFFQEAYFRIGLDYFRMADFKTAANSWNEAYRRSRDSSQKDRVLYWISKCHEKEGNYKEQLEILKELSERPVDSYYTLKAFFLTRDLLENSGDLDVAFWELHQSDQTFLPDYISNFSRALLVEEILGPRWGDRELRTLDYTTDEWQEVYALGELYERMQNFGYAYRRFRNVFDQEFISADISEMIPIFKKLYPLYFYADVDSAARKFAVSPELIWSVIKKESAFEPEIISYANAYGLMQLLPGTASQVAPKLGTSFTSTRQLFDPSTNIMMGTCYLASLLEKYDGNYVMALAGYNAGPHRVDRWKQRFPTYDDDLFMENLEFEQTRVYVRTCLKYYWIYRAITNPGQIPDELLEYPKQFSEYINS
ncbi:MAG: hypothetical protein EH225_08495 [Calditrichaeota bacterium]|nr:transglycosylase SLT domain-containing protein [Calditrichota bacterium]RQW02420.1 MAG: hypothetical protein EH225_08495 [Calditrichota bacterium]